MRLPNNDEIFILLGIIGILIMVIPQTRVEIGGIGLLLVLALGIYYLLFVQERKESKKTKAKRSKGKKK